MHFYVYTYDKETKKTFYRSLHADDLEAAIAAVRSLVERGTETPTMDRPR
jgi:hypothetical protein